MPAPLPAPPLLVLLVVQYHHLVEGDLGKWIDLQPRDRENISGAIVDVRTGMAASAAGSNVEDATRSGVGAGWMMRRE